MLTSAVVCGGILAGTVGGDEPESLPTNITLGGEVKRNHLIEMRMSDGPAGSETFATFRDNRFDVVFTHQATGEVVNVPGFWASVVNAHSSAVTNGTVWIARFCPPLTGRWDFSIVFRTGASQALTVPVGTATGGSAGPHHGQSGWFTVAESDKFTGLWSPVAGHLVARDRIPGGLSAAHMPMWRNDPTRRGFTVAGTDSPEVLFGYNEFDNTVGYAPNGGVTRNYSTAHDAHYRTGDPDWSAKDIGGNGTVLNGAGRDLIGLVNYVADKGLNGMNAVLFNEPGDGDNCWPWVAAPDSVGTGAARFAQGFDVSKLDQWNRVFSHAMTRGLTFVIKFQEAENDWLIDGGQSIALGVNGKVLLREFVSRFGWYPGVRWCVSEEPGLGSSLHAQVTSRLGEWSSHLQSLDPYGHIVSTHTLSNGDTFAQNHLGPDNVATFDGVNYQLESAANPFTIIGSRRAEVRGDGRKLWISYEEQTPANDGVLEDSITSEAVTGAPVHRRKFDLYACFVNGSGWLTYFGGNSAAGAGDINAVQLTSRSTWWDWLHRFKQICEYSDTRGDGPESDNAIIAGTVTVGDGHANGGKIANQQYAVHLASGTSTGTLSVALGTGTYECRWLCPRTTEALWGRPLANPSQKTGTFAAGAPPANTGEDWVLLCCRVDQGVEVADFVLVNADTGRDIAVLYDGVVVDLAHKDVNTQNIAVRVRTWPGLVGSVLVEVDGSGAVERDAPPYAVHGDSAGVYAAWLAPNGEHTITAIAYPQALAAGTPSAQASISFTVVGSSGGSEPPPGAPVTDFSGATVTDFSGAAVTDP